MDSEKLRETIVGTLKRREAQKIDFHCGSRAVNRSILNQVVDRLNNGKLFTDPDPSALSTPSAEAQYSPRKRTLFFKSEDYGSVSSAEQGTIVHESVHAGFHVIGHGEKFLRIDNEPSAYLAEAFFLVNCGWRFEEISNRPMHLQLAFTIALNMRSQKRSSVSRDDLKLLRNGIARLELGYDTETRFGTDKDYQGIPK
ncbi:hypothetical protein [Bradyrhizobium lablabi]|uniref:hypothetical protein n=1 Tax=Bradyrhizobium lablabi TaxID=722472 RepID=UPI001BA5CF34|nr:hypothetical protein [Bradyrhizobium lablabi]MBR0695813.1 hypothetical protein [Bradyrhizobium lablabi]